MRRTHAIWATIRRNLRLLRREPDLVAQTIILPTAILLLVAVVFGGGGDRWPIAVIDESGGDRAARVIRAIERSNSRITPYFDVRRLDLSTASEMVEAGRLHMLVRIPADFDRTNTVETKVFNINTDATKNVRLRLDHALNAVDAPTAPVDYELTPARPHDPWRSAYIGGSAVLLALLLGSALTAANLFVFEREHRTRTEAMLTPLGPATAGAAIAAVATVAAAVASLVPLAVSVAAFNLEVDAARLAAVYAAATPLMVTAAGVGILLGHLLGSYRNVQPVIVILALATFFGGGGFVGVTTLQPAAQAVADAWLPSRTFTWLNPVLHGFAPGLTAGQWAGAAAAATLGVLLIAFTYRLERARPPGGASP